MFRFNFYLSALLVSIGFLISACSSNGDSNTTYGLHELQTTKPGVIYSTALTGNDSDNIEYNGSITIENKDPIMRDGVLVTPRDIVIVLSAGGITVSLTGTSYIDENGNLTSIVVHNNGTICTPASPDKVPGNVEIGDSGVRSTLTCSNNTTNETNWNTKAGGNNEIRFISTSLIKDQLGEIVSANIVSFNLDSSGNIVSFNANSTHSASNYMFAYHDL